MKTHKSIRIENELIAKIERFSKEQNRSFNNSVEAIIFTFFKQRPFPEEVTMENINDYQLIGIKSTVEGLLDFDTKK